MNVRRWILMIATNALTVGLLWAIGSIITSSSLRQWRGDIWWACLLVAGFTVIDVCMWVAVYRGGKRK
jgi:hypothetical protein